MARGGVNKALVQNAREALIAKGQNPSIDAIRVELGNTGSKSTIHRYLKELEEEAAARLDDEALLSEPIKELVGRLAAVLRQEASALVDEADKRCAAQLASRDSEVAQQSHALTAAQRQIEDLCAQLSEERSNNERLSAAIKTLEQKSSADSETMRELRARVEEKGALVSSLEEKHAHARHALDHYRDSVKEQREQDRRQHGSQLQQLQSEALQLRQTLSVKQTEATELNKDNARLVAELRHAQQLVQQLRTDFAASDQERQSSAALLTSMEEAKIRDQGEIQALHEANASLSSANQALEEDNRSLHLRVAKLEARIETQAEWINRLGSSGGQGAPITETADAEGPVDGGS